MVHHLYQAKNIAAIECVSPGSLKATKHTIKKRLGDSLFMTLATFGTTSYATMNGW